jgi:hypothetical protein
MVVYVPYHACFVPAYTYRNITKSVNYKYNGERIVGYLQEIENKYNGLQAHIYPDPTGHDHVVIYLIYKNYATRASIESFTLEEDYGCNDAIWLIDRSLEKLLDAIQNSTT